MESMDSYKKEVVLLIMKPNMRCFSLPKKKMAVNEQKEI
jgi:hypothetical protein